MDSRHESAHHNMRHDRVPTRVGSEGILIGGKRLVVTVGSLVPKVH